MTVAGPLVFRCVLHNELGLALVPLERFARQAHDQYDPGQTYFLGEVEERSEVSHNHQFAWLKDAWLSLPEALADQFPTQDHLRRHALIVAGFYDETRLDCGTNAAALRVAALMRSDNPYAAVVVRGPLVVRRVAKSQSRRTMDRAEFQASKTGMMEVIAELISVDPAQLSTSSQGTGARKGVGAAA